MATTTQNQNLCDVSYKIFLPSLYLGLKRVPAVLPPEAEVQVRALLTRALPPMTDGYFRFVDYSNHNYCGKTCSQQAAAMNQTNAVPAPAPPQPQAASTLCKVLVPPVCFSRHLTLMCVFQQCNQKPKFQNFEFCGKNCAATWQLAHGSSNGTANPPTKKPTGNVIGQVLPNVQIPPQLLGQIRTFPDCLGGMVI